MNKNIKKRCPVCNDKLIDKGVALTYCKNEFDVHFTQICYSDKFLIHEYSFKNFVICHHIKTFGENNTIIYDYSKSDPDGGYTAVYNEFGLFPINPDTIIDDINNLLILE